MIAEAELIEHAKTGMLMRPYTLDDYVINERNQYLAMDPQPEDVLLDIGANIGAVSRTFLDKGIKGAVAYEPDPDNAWLCRKNTEQFKNFLFVEAAVASEAGSRTLWLNTGKNKGMHSLVQRRGRDEVEVVAHHFGQVLETYKPTLLKVDIEGGEYELAPWLYAVPSQVRSIALEVHLQGKDADGVPWREKAAPEMLAAVEAQGFEAVRVPKITPKGWVTMGVWKR